jgi:hypothetical protein
MQYSRLLDAVPPLLVHLTPLNWSKESTLMNLPASKTQVGFTNSDISNYLNLPPVKLHCSMLAEDAIKKAMEDYRKKNPENAISEEGTKTTQIA